MTKLHASHFDWSHWQFQLTLWKFLDSNSMGDERQHIDDTNWVSITRIQADRHVSPFDELSSRYTILIKQFTSEYFHPWGDSCQPSTKMMWRFLLVSQRVYAMHRQDVRDTSIMTDNPIWLMFQSTHLLEFNDVLDYCRTNKIQTGSQCPTKSSISQHQSVW